MHVRDNIHVACILSPVMQAVASMVEQCCRFVDQAPDLEIKLKLIDTLRTVTEGKVCVHFINNCVLDIIHTM